MADAEAARRRSEYVAALQEERVGYERSGKPDRVAQVDAELARVTGAPIHRSETPTEPGPIQRSRPTKPKS